MLKPFPHIPLTVASILLGGCSMSPSFKRPDTPVPTAYWSSETRLTPIPVAMPQWGEFVQDQQLRGLIERALLKNRDLRNALINVQAMRAQFVVSRADRIPQLSANAGGQRSRLPINERSDRTVPLESSHNASLALSAFEIDLFGRVKSLSESSFHQYLAQEQTARAARIALIAAVSDAYLRFQTALSKQQLTKEVQISREQSLRLVQLKRENAQASSLDEEEATGLVEESRIQGIAAEQETFQSRSALLLLIGDNTAADALRPIAIIGDVFGELSPGLPSDLLARRPDLLAAEHRIRAANFDIGAARAAFFPQISLTAMWGATSPELSNLFSTNNRKWQFTPQATLPVFSGGKNRANLDIARLRKDASIVAYEQTVQVAFTEVNDALIEANAARQRYEAQRKLTHTGEAALSTAKLRYETGVDSYVRFLDAQVRYAKVKQDEVDAWSSLQASRIHVFKAIGGDMAPPASHSK